MPIYLQKMIDAGYWYQQLILVMSVAGKDF